MHPLMERQRTYRAEAVRVLSARHPLAQLNATRSAGIGSEKREATRTNKQRADRQRAAQKQINKEAK